MSKLLRQWLEDSRALALNNIAELIEQEKIPEARITKGSLNFLNTVLAAFDPQERSEPPAEPVFVDPAAIERKAVTA